MIKNKTIEQYKKGDLITTINGVNYYYLCKDPIMKYKNKPCHFLTTNLDNSNYKIRVSEQIEKWKTFCKEHYLTYY